MQLLGLAVRRLDLTLTLTLTLARRPTSPLPFLKGVFPSFVKIVVYPFALPHDRHLGQLRAPLHPPFQVEGSPVNARVVGVLWRAGLSGGSAIRDGANRERVCGGPWSACRLARAPASPPEGGGSDVWAEPVRSPESHGKSHERAAGSPSVCLDGGI